MRTRRDDASRQAWADAGVDTVLTGEVTGLHPRGRPVDPAGGLLPRLNRLEASLPVLEAQADPRDFALALFARCLLLQAAAAPTADRAAALDDLRRLAHARRLPRGTALALAARSALLLESGDAGQAAADLAVAYPTAMQAADDDPMAVPLLGAVVDGMAAVCLFDEHDAACRRLDDLLAHRTAAERSRHWISWASTLAIRALLPVALADGPAGPAAPDTGALQRAVEVAGRVDLLAEPVPAPLTRSAAAVRALAASYRDRPSESLRVLGEDSFGAGRDLAPAIRQIATLTAVRAHARVGSLATARMLDEAEPRAGSTGPLLLVSEAVRARERMWLEAHGAGDLAAVQARFAGSLAGLSAQLLDIVSRTAALAVQERPVGEGEQPAGSRYALDVELRRLLRTGPMPVALVIVDVDDVAAINDRFTPAIGDEVLRRVGGTLRAQLRGADRMLRCGDDEFALLLPGTGLHQAGHAADRLRAEVAARAWDELAAGLRVSVTTGCAAVTSLSGRRPDADADRLVRRAQEALATAATDTGQWSASTVPARRRRAAGPALLPRRRAGDGPAAPHADPSRPHGRRARH